MQCAQGKTADGALGARSEVKAECARQREGKFVQNCSPGRGERQAGVQRSVQEAGGLLCVLGRGEGRENRGAWRGGKGC